MSTGKAYRFGQRPGLVSRGKLAIVSAWLGIQNGLLRFFAGLLYRKPGHINHVMIFRTGSLGDNICASPSIAAIRARYPAAKLTLLTDASTAFPISMQNVLLPELYDEIIDYLKMPKKQLIAVLRAKEVDLLIQLPQRDAPLLRLVRDLFFFRLVARSGWGWRVSTVRWFKKTQEQYSIFLNETDRLLALVAAHGINTTGNRSFPVKLTAEDERKTDEVFLQNGLAESRPIAIVVGGKRPQNRWPEPFFREVIQHFSREYRIILLGSKADLALTKTLEGLPGVINFCGQFTAMQSGVALKKCVLTLSNDTGPMHLSYAVGTPVVGLFSSRDFPGKWYPPDDGLNRTLRTEHVPCSICLSETCTNNICMQAITPAQVIQVMEEVLSAIHSKQGYRQNA